MFLLNGKRINIDAQIQINGVTYSNLRNPALRAQLGIVEVPDPVYPDPDLFYWTENENGTLTVTPKSAEQVLALRKGQFLAGVQAHLDSKASERGYDSIVSACSYAGAPNPFQAESQVYVAWRGNVWAYCYAELLKVENGTRPLPVLADFIAELPELVLA